MYICASMRNIYIVFLCILSSNFSFAQNKSAYRDEIAAGDKLLAKKAYSGALHNFKDAYTLDSSSANVAYKIGLCLFNIGDREGQAIRFFQKATQDVSKEYNENNEKEKSASPLSYYYLGILYQETYHFTHAVTMFKKFKTYNTPDIQAYLAKTAHLIEQCQSAAMYVMAPSNAKIINMGGGINSAYSDYNLLLQQDGSMAIFTSRRPNGKNTGDVMPDGQYTNAI